jgi:hypothetical protein
MPKPTAKTDFQNPNSSTGFGTDKPAPDLTARGRLERGYQRPPEGVQERCYLLPASLHCLAASRATPALASATVIPKSAAASASLRPSPPATHGCTYSQSSRSRQTDSDASWGGSSGSSALFRGGRVATADDEPRRRGLPPGPDSFPAGQQDVPSARI